MTIRKPIALVAAAALLTSTFVAVNPAHAVVPTVKWDDGGMAEVVAPPLTWELELTEFSNPREITQRQIVEVDVSLVDEIEACSAELVMIPQRDGVPIGDPVAIDAGEYYAYESVYVPVNVAGTYQIAITGNIVTANPYCFIGSPLSTPYAITIDLFTIEQDIPGPAGREKVQVSSSGVHTLTANTQSKSRSIRITFDVRDPEKRSNLLYRICVKDSYDCWFEDAPLRKRSNIKKTSEGWRVTWDFYWERSSPSDCLSYYWRQPDVGVVLVVSNRDGRQVGRKKHGVRLTCRP